MPSIGDQLAGRYRIDAQIGSGGFATVFRASDLQLHRDVAVKVLLANHATDPVIATRFEREARALAAVSHPNVVAVHDVGPGDPATGAEPFLVMDLCAGGSLALRFAASAAGALSPDDLVPILVDVAAGLDALHERGIVHRDLKPSNVLLSDGRARISDLGIAAAGPSELTEPGTAIGTLAYLAPEQLAGESGSPASDVHALGVIAFLGLTGRLPRAAGSVTELVAASVQPVDPVSAFAPSLGTASDAAITRALAGDPSRRPTPTELGASLEAALERWRAEPMPVATDDATTRTALPLPVAAAATGLDVGVTGVAATGGPATRGRGGRTVAVVVTLIAAFLLGLGAFVLVRPDGSPDRESPSLAGGGSATSPSASATPAAIASPAPSPAPSPTLAPTLAPTPRPTVDLYGDARAASVEMRKAIAAARGQDGLNGREPKDLESRIDRFDRALDKLDAVTARDEANKLAGQVAKIVDKGAVNAQAAARLRTAADGLVAAANALPK